MTTTTALDRVTYRNARAAGHKPRAAGILARIPYTDDRYMIAAGVALESDRTDMTHDGWTVRVTVTPDPYGPELDGWGTFTDDPAGAVPNDTDTPHGYRYFRPEWSIDDRRAHYGGPAGMARHAAWLEAHRTAREDAAIARELRAVNVTATVMRAGVTLAACGVTVDDARDRPGVPWHVGELELTDTVADVLRDIVPEACHEAAGILLELTGGAA
jgi:hypothetical protein